MQISKSPIISGYEKICFTERRNPQYYYIGDRFLSALHIYVYIWLKYIPKYTLQRDYKDIFKRIRHRIRLGCYWYKFHMYI